MTEEAVGRPSGTMPGEMNDPGRGVARKSGFGGTGSGWEGIP